MLLPCPCGSPVFLGNLRKEVVCLCGRRYVLEAYVKEPVPKAADFGGSFEKDIVHVAQCESCHWWFLPSALTEVRTSPNDDELHCEACRKETHMPRTCIWM
jgi:hypothetical protein